MRKCWLVVLFFCAASFIYSQAHAQYLVPGVGLGGILEIGQLGGTGAQRGVWNDHGSGLQFKVDYQGIVVLIKCQRCKYPTDRNVRVGSPESDVLRWYGAAREKRLTPQATLFSYLGISFAIRDGQVMSIYIFPRYLLKK